jgi:hypothetical protein
MTLSGEAQAIKPGPFIYEMIHIRMARATDVSLISNIANVSGTAYGGGNNPPP